ncbi:PREDICTED: elongation of very long chain fatty acids protein 7-like [Rhagoletis zephyria]|uniref:elongation of very long chain fatty acids protein 7-like n=1 Tax=Rhagoletis zephyria TaxID=28612 RepID=UPI00081179D9|nr:PREDICTED: elongation of very long chain fatty acids protein 7-like [Rhagoletis zephyria]
MSSVRVPGTVLTAYLLFVLWIGPWWMARRERAFSLKPLLLVYNLALAAYNGYVFARLLLNPGHLVERVLDTRYPPVEDRSEWTLAVIDDIYIYTLSKYVDLLDTVFFVLRKKQSQVTALHLYHHFMVAANGWVIFRLCALCNVCSLFVLLNSGIHLLMYSYYALSALGPAVRPYLWWKRYITQAQIGQFVLLFIHSVYFTTTQVGYSPYYTYHYIATTVIYCILFGRFYLKAYRQQQQQQVKKAVVVLDKKEN